MKEAAPAGQIGIPSFSPEHSALRNLTLLPRDEDLAMVQRMTDRLVALKGQGLKGIHLVCS